MLAWGVCPGEETIAAYVGGRLPRVERDGVDSHLDTCAACQELVAALAKVQPRDATTDASEAALAGTLGRYVLHARLGAGGMGVVYAAYDPELDRRVALKVLRHAGAQLRDEARAIAKLAHPNVIAIHDVGEADGELFIAMEHVDGVTLRDWLRESHPPAEILDVFVQAGRGLAAAHRAGLVHRDVKPSNIIVGSDGRARVLDFGLARGGEGDAEPAIVGTPGYMAPEQRRGERVDARADQYAFAVALWEALGGKRDADRLDGVADPIVRALRRARQDDPAARYGSLDELLDELAPPAPRANTWAIATVVIVLAIVAGLAFTLTRRDPAAPCARAGDPVTAVWSDKQRAALRTAFAATKLPYAATAADATIGELDAWATRWRDRATASCRATLVDRVQPAASHALRTTCLAELLERLRPTVVLATAADVPLVAQADSLVRALPAPDRCDDVAALSALPPLPPAERDRAEIATLRAEIAEHETALLAGRAEQVRARILALHDRTRTLAYLPLRARSELLVARLQSSSAHYDEAIAGFHAAARDATAARDLTLLAEIWIELSQTLGNDPRYGDEATLFDGYASSLIAQLPNRALYELDLEFARCNRNVTAADAATVATHCQAAIDQAAKLTPPRTAIAIASRVRLGHFLRLQGKPADGIATLRKAVEEATAFHGAQHPDVAIAHYALGLALLSTEDLDGGIAELRTALDIRRAAYPGGSVQVAESLSGLGDALASAGKHTEAIPLLEQALAMLDAAHQPESAHAVNAHILLGMSLEEVNRAADALPHYLRAADVADRVLQHREPLAAMALRLAANTVRDKPAAGIPYLERAVRLLERGKASPADLAATQSRLDEFRAQAKKHPRP